LWLSREARKCGGLDKMTEGYCVKDKKKVEIQGGVMGKTKRGVAILKGKCPLCGTIVCRIGGK